MHGKNISCWCYLYLFSAIKPGRVPLGSLWFFKFSKSWVGLGDTTWLYVLFYWQWHTRCVCVTPPKSERVYCWAMATFLRFVIRPLDESPGSTPSNGSGSSWSYVLVLLTHTRIIMLIICCCFTVLKWLSSEISEGASIWCNGAVFDAQHSPLVFHH